MTLLLAAALLFGYPDSVRLVGRAYGGSGAIGGAAGGARVSVRRPDGRVYVSYSKGGSTELGDSSEVVVVCSDDDGLTWSPIENVSRDGDSLSIHPALALDSTGGLHCTWFKYVGPGSGYDDFDLYYSHSAGDSWSWPVNISRMHTNTNAAEHSSICTDAAGRIHVAFEYTHGYLPEIYYTAPAGDTWLTPVLVSDSPLDDGFPCIGGDSRNRLHLVWRIRGSDSGYVMYSRKDSTWSAPQRIAACVSAVNSASLAVGADDVVHVTYAGRIWTGRMEVYYTSLSGDTWSQPVNLSQSDWAESFCPSVAVSDEGTVVAVWTELPAASPYQAMVRFREDSRWLPAVNLSADSINSAMSGRVGTQVLNDRVDVVWQDLDVDLSGQDPPYDTTYVYYLKVLVPTAAVSEREAPRPTRPERCATVVAGADGLKRYAVPAGSGRLVVVDALGRVVFAARTDGRPVELALPASAVYVCRYVGPDVTACRKLVLRR